MLHLSFHFPGLVAASAHCKMFTLTSPEPGPDILIQTSLMLITRVISISRNGKLLVWLF